MVSLHFLPTAPGEIGDLDGHAVVFDGEAGEFAQTGPFGCVIGRGVNNIPTGNP